MTPSCDNVDVGPRAAVADAEAAPGLVILPSGDPARSHRRCIEIAPSYRPESRAPAVCRSGTRLAGASDVWRAQRDIHFAQQEHFIIFDVDVRHRVIARRVLGIGSLTGVEVHPREVFRQAIVNAAAAVILAHNHPSLDPTPSRQDLELTGRVREVGDLVGIPVLDHVVVGGDGYVSLAQRNWR